MLLVVGNSGRIGSEICKYFAENSYNFRTISALGALKLKSTTEYEVVINASGRGVRQSDKASLEELEQINIRLPELLAKLCKASDSYFLHFGSELERDRKRADSYARTKSLGSQSVVNALESDLKGVVLNLPLIFGNFLRPSIIEEMIIHKHNGIEFELENPSMVRRLLWKDDLMPIIDFLVCGKLQFDFNNLSLNNVQSYQLSFIMDKITSVMSQLKSHSEPKKPAPNLRLSFSDTKISKTFHQTEIEFSLNHLISQRS